MVQPLDKPDLPRRYASLADFREGARRRIPNFAFEYLDSGIGRDANLARNYAALDRVLITPRLSDDERPADASVEIFGQRYAAPFSVAPLGFVGLFHPRCAPAFARRSAKLNIPYTLSFVSSSDTEEILHASGRPPWQQIYWPRDEGAQDHFLARMKSLGVEVVMPTVDIPGPQWRERVIRADFAGRPSLPTMMRDIALRPRWAFDMLRGPIPGLPQLSLYSGARDIQAAETWLKEQCTRPVGREEVARLRDKWDGKLVIKGVMAPEDAEDFAALGVDGVVVSNHGGRQLDAAPGSAELLPPIVEAVKGKMAILVDGGVANGLDVLRMIRLGADFVLVGRLAYYAAAALGPRGAAVLDLVALQIRDVMVQMGVRSLDELMALKMEIAGR